MKGYKAFNKDWTCRGKQYKVGETYTEERSPIPCESGMHFCGRLIDVFQFYYFDKGKTVVAEVETLGKIATDDNIKFCTDKLRIVREIPWDEVLTLCNAGHRNTGLGNTGSFNTGSWNTGFRNTGDSNTGEMNTGGRNTGNLNTGKWNTGSFNTGSRNTGYRNTGSWNTGDWNISSYNNGCFMTIEPKIQMFNKPSDWTLSEWRENRAFSLLMSIPTVVPKWVDAEKMSDTDKRPSAQIWWEELKDEERNCILSLPNFDPEIFKECVGIDVGSERGDEQ